MSLDPTLPIKLDSTSNGEYAPWPVGRTVTHAKHLAAERIATHAYGPRDLGEWRRFRAVHGVGPS
jgi:hypothetical protein